jgi:predicted phage baseplate assembly protein
MSDAILDPTVCGCCEGTRVQTPHAIGNLPGLAAIAYRAGTWSRFRESILARLASADHPALAALASRDDDDFTIALADAFAVMADVLSFYQERIASEAFLRTSTERRSVLELARLIGYAPSPGVAAQTWLAFTLEEARGAPAQAATPVTIEAGTRVQSVPGPGELPQSFEVLAPIEARVERNAMCVQTRVPQPIEFGLTELYLAGSALQLAPGDVILIVGAERRRYPRSERWDVRVLSAVEPDDRRGFTRVAWREPLGHVRPSVQPADPPVDVFVFRARAALFGHNAPAPSLFSSNGTNLSALVNTASTPWTWKNFAGDGQVIDLDQQYPKIVPQSWIVLVSAAIRHRPSSLPGYVELYRAAQVSHPSRTGFGLSGKITRITPDAFEHLGWYGLQDTLVLAQSEPLAMHERPVRDPLYGDRVALAALAPGLAKGQALALSGKRQHLRVVADAGPLWLLRADGTRIALAAADRLALMATPTRTLGDGSVEQVEPAALMAALAARDAAPLTWTLADRDGVTGTLVAGAGALQLDAALDADAAIAEVALIATAADAVEHDRDRTRLRLAARLRHCYDRDTVAINGNVAAASHGESVSEILGSGDAAADNQSFALKQAPLTRVIADTPAGSRSTLELRVGDNLWREVPALYGAPPTERVFVTQTQDDGTSFVRFGDGVEGARLPTGQQNLRASYRKGLGTAGNVAAGRLTTLLKRPLGVTAVTNPEAAAGGADAESLDTARSNAPLTVLTLERAVSLTDYEDFSAGFAGIAKAHAAWIGHGAARGVHVTVAGPDGAAIGTGSTTWQGLMDALRGYGDPLVPISVRSYRAARFRLAATVRVAADKVTADVLDAVRAALRAAFAFAARDFGQTVSVDEVARVAHGVPGVEAIDVDLLRRTDQPASPAVRPRLFAALPLAGDGDVLAAEILVLDHASLDIRVMP